MNIKIQKSKIVAKDPWKSNIHERVTFLDMENIDFLAKNRDLAILDLTEDKPLDSLLRVLHDKDAFASSRLWCYVTGIDFSLAYKQMFD